MTKQNAVFILFCFHWLQTGSEPELQAVFHDLLNADGCELFVRQLAAYQLQPGNVPWHWLQELARSRGTFMHVCVCVRA